ncbi:hypothetical protein, partial [Neobacillus drentensis]|uniref:hypothetical protein n=1 Tax=Neobacillus drentensis TaxID=220684 RepID=UPI0030022FBB
ALQRWEDIIRPIAEKTQIWSRIYGAAASNWPKDLLSIRSEIIKQVMDSENIDQMLSLAARHVTGSKEVYVG